MFLPIGDTPNPGGRPLANYLLIGVNIAVFLFVSLPLTLQRPDLADPLLHEYLRAMGAEGRIPVADILRHVTAYDLFVFRYGFRPAEFSVATLFAAMFLHGGWMHLIGNMLFLWIYGDNVEHRLGHFWYLLAYLATGVAATLFFTLFVPGSEVPMIGASGAISGVLGCYFLWFPRNRVKTFVFLFPFIMTTFLIPARLVLGIYLLVDNLLPFLVSAGGAGGVAHGAHIGGFVAGLVLAWGMTLGSRAVPEQKRFVSPVERVTSSVRAGNVGQATLFYLSLADAERRQVPTHDLLEIGEYLLDRRDHHGALTVFRRIISERPNDPDLDRAYLGAGGAARAIPRGAASAYQYFLAAIDVARTPEIAEAARRHLRAMDAA
jgi:membrane associated rhomboid family serine protease